ncbi:MAG: hypothetical protein ACLQKA_01180 [Bryobacteraceae bacterium]
MKHRFRRCILLAAFAGLSLAQIPRPKPPENPEIKFPDGKSQRDRMLKAEMTENRKEAAQLAELAQQLQSDLDKNSQYVFSLADLKKADEIEKLAHRIRTRMQHN